MSTATVTRNEKGSKAPFLLPQTLGLKAIFTAIRDRTAPQEVFVPNARRIMRMLIEAALDLLPHKACAVETPSGGLYQGQRLAVRVCGVSVLRAGDSLESEFRAVLPSDPIGKILIQRDPETKLPKFFFAKFPDDIADRHVLLLDPMLATGGTAVEACGRLVSHGVPPQNIVFVSLLSAPVGLDKLASAFPNVRILTASVEPELTSQAFMLPGIGDFGDRFFGTYTPRPSRKIPQEISPSTNSVEVVKEWYSTGNIDLLSESIDCTAIGYPVERKRYLGKPAMLGDFFGAIRAQFDVWDMHVDRVFGDGNEVTALGCYRAKPKGGTIRNLPFVHVWTVADGQLVGIVASTDCDSVG